MIFLSLSKFAHHLIEDPQSIKTIKNYRIDYEWNGVMGSSYTYNNYVIGQLIPISINIIAKWAGSAFAIEPGYDAWVNGTVIAVAFEFNGL